MGWEVLAVEPIPKCALNCCVPRLLTEAEPKMSSSEVGKGSLESRKEAEGAWVSLGRV